MVRAKLHDESWYHKGADASCCFPALGIMVFLGLFCSIQMLIAVASSAALDLSLLRYTTATMNNTLQPVIGRISSSHLQQLMFQAEAAILREFSSTAKCAQTIADDFRIGKISPVEPDKVISSLWAATIHWGARNAYFGMPTLEYMNVAKEPGQVVGASPVFKVSTSMMDTNGQHLMLGSLNTTVVEFDISAHGQLDTRSGRVALEGFELFNRPWFSLAMEARVPILAPPFLWIPDGDLGLDICVPIIQESDSGTASASASSTGVASPTLLADADLSMVVCCDRTLSEFSQVLAEIDYGEDGFAYLIEADGPSAGKLLAAAESDRTLPVVEEIDRDDDGKVDDLNRLSVRDYPVSYHPRISRSANLLWLRHESWSRAGNQTIERFASTDSGDDGVLLTTALLNGRIDGWGVNERGLWSRENYQVRGVPWLLVVAVRVQDVSNLPVSSSAENSLSELEQEALRINIISVPLAVLISFLISYFAMSPVKMKLRRICILIQSLQKLPSAQPLPNSLVLPDQEGGFQPIADVFETFVRMKACVVFLSKFVPTPVLGLIPDHEDFLMPADGKPSLDHKHCSVLVGLIANFPEMLNTCSSQMLIDTLERYFRAVSNVVQDAGGILTDFNGPCITVLFPDSVMGHESVACKAVRSIVQNLAQWDKMQSIVDIQCSFGVHTGKVYVGSFGSAFRLKFGAVGENVDLAIRLANLAITYKTECLISSYTERALRGGFISQHMGALTQEGEEIGFHRLVTNEGSFKMLPVSPATRQGSMKRFKPARLEFCLEGMQERDAVLNFEHSTDRKRYWSDFGSLVLIAMCTIQILVALAIISAIEVPILLEASKLLNASLHEAVDELSGRHQTELIEKSINLVVHSISDLPRCAAHLASEFRTSKLTLDDPGMIELALYHFSIYWNTAYAYFGTRENLYAGMYRKNDLVWGGQPFFSLGSNMHNDPPFNVTSHTDTSLIDFQVMEDGTPIYSSATLAVKGSQSRLRPWYNRTRHVGKPTWIPPFVWTPDLVLGIDACVPVYDSTGRQKLDSAAGPYDVWNESLAVVTCCDSTLEGLSEILAGQDLGANGVAYIVEAGTGLLLAAAQKNVQLPVAQTVIAGGLINGFETSSVIERISAVGYPEQDNKLISQLSTHLLDDGRRKWDQIQNETFSVQGVTSAKNGTVTIGIKTAVMDGSIPGWKVDAKGRWSDSDYQLEGMRWVLVVAICPEDFLSIQEKLDANDAQIRQNIWLRILIAVAIVGFNFLICIPMVRIATAQLKGLQDQMERVRLLRLDKQPFILSKILEVRDIQNAYENLRERLHRLQHYVPKSITTRIGRGADLQEIQEDILSMGFEEATVIYCHLNNFPQLSEALSRKDLLQVMEHYLDRINQAVGENAGNLNDFDGFSFSAYWLDTDEEGVHAQRACQAACAVKEVVSALNSNWSRFEWSLPPGIELKTTVGIQSGAALIGSYGTRDRLKFGTIGEIVENSHKIAVLAKTVGKSILVHDSTRDLIHGCYKSKFVASTQLGLLYELGPRSKNFDRPPDIEFEDVAVPNGIVGTLKQAAASLVGSVESILRVSSNASRDSSQEDSTSRQSSRRPSSELYKTPLKKAGSEGILIGASTTSSEKERRFMKMKRAGTSGQLLSSPSDSLLPASSRPATLDRIKVPPEIARVASLDAARIQKLKRDVDVFQDFDSNSNSSTRSTELSQPIRKASSFREEREKRPPVVSEEVFGRGRSVEHDQGSDSDGYAGDFESRNFRSRTFESGKASHRSNIEKPPRPVRKSSDFPSLEATTPLGSFTNQNVLSEDSSPAQRSREHRNLEASSHYDSFGQNRFTSDFDSNLSSNLFDSNLSVDHEAPARAPSTTVVVNIDPQRQTRRQLKSNVESNVESSKASSVVTPRQLEDPLSKKGHDMKSLRADQETLPELELPRRGVSSSEFTEEESSSEDELTMGLLKGDPNAFRKSLQLVRTTLEKDRSLDDRREFTPRTEADPLGDSVRSDTMQPSRPA